MTNTTILDPREIEHFNTIDIVRLRNFRDLDMDEVVDNDLMEFYMRTNIMPYSVAKARTEDPYNWIFHRVDAYFDYLLSN